MNPDQFRLAPATVDPAMRDAFIAELRDCGVVVEAAARLGLTPCSLYRARKKFPGFAEVWDSIAGHRPADVIDPVELERALFNRLRRGVKRRRFYKGVMTDTYREFHESEAFKMLAKLMPGKYGDGSEDIAPPVEAPSRAEIIAGLAAIGARNRARREADAEPVSDQLSGETAIESSYTTA